MLGQPDVAQAHRRWGWAASTHLQRATYLLSSKASSDEGVCLVVDRIPVNHLTTRALVLSRRIIARYIHEWRTLSALDCRLRQTHDTSLPTIAPVSNIRTRLQGDWDTFG